MIDGTCIPPTNCMGDGAVCVECRMGKRPELTSCVNCQDRCERCTKELCLRCSDNSVLVDGTCVEKDSTALLVLSNKTLKCSESFFPDCGECQECPEACLSCRDASTCSVCVSGTSISGDGACARLDTATAQTHAGAIACKDGYVASGGLCASCADLFASVCPACTLCDGDRCLRCDGDVVFDNGAWRASQHCAAADGAVCQTCDDGALRFNATDCVLEGDCVVYEDGKCIQCSDSFVPLADGTCAESEDCTFHNGGVCLRCTDGMFADESGVCQCSSQK